MNKHADNLKKKYIRTTITNDNEVKDQLNNVCLNSFS